MGYYIKRRRKIEKGVLGEIGRAAKWGVKAPFKAAKFAYKAPAKIAGAGSAMAGKAQLAAASGMKAAGVKGAGMKAAKMGTGIKAAGTWARANPIKAGAIGVGVLGAGLYARRKARQRRRREMRYSVEASNLMKSVNELDGLAEDLNKGAGVGIGRAAKKVKRIVGRKYRKYVPKYYREAAKAGTKGIPGKRARRFVARDVTATALRHPVLAAAGVTPGALATRKLVRRRRRKIDERKARAGR